MKNLVITGGGTAGHLFPAITLGNELKKTFNIHIITDTRCQKYLDRSFELKLYFINCRSISRAYLRHFLVLLKIIYYTLYDIWLFIKIKPSMVIGFGGYTTIPALTAALILRIPIVLYEQNSIIGKTNKFFLKFSKKLFLASNRIKNIQNSMNNKKVVVGYLLRKKIIKISTKRNFNDKKFRILVLGGSQGAKIFSTIIPEVIQKLKKENKKLSIHITQQVSSNEDIKNISVIYKKLKISYRLFCFSYSLEKEYIKHNLLISRAGANTIGEIIYLGIPTIFIPLPSASENHQLYNAKTLVKQKAAWCFVQDESLIEKLTKKICELATQREILTQTSTNLLTLRNNGNKIFAKLIKRMVK